MSVPLGLKVAFFAITLVRIGDLNKTVLDSWSSNCTLWSHPAPYPFELQKLAGGRFSWRGIKQIFGCSLDPEWEAFFRRLPRRGITLGNPAINQPVSRTVQHPHNWPEAFAAFRDRQEK